MDISGVGRSVPVSLESVHTVPDDRAAQHREIVQAVKALNGAEMFGRENELAFQRDPDTQRLVVRIVNRKTGESVAQLPDDYVLELAQDLEQPEE